jgi:hypothetical protein
MEWLISRSFQKWFLAEIEAGCACDVRFLVGLCRIGAGWRASANPVG